MYTCNPPEYLALWIQPSTLSLLHYRHTLFEVPSLLFSLLLGNPLLPPDHYSKPCTDIEAGPHCKDRKEQHTYHHTGCCKLCIQERKQGTHSSPSAGGTDGTSHCCTETT